MQLFYASVTDKIVELPEVEAIHCVKALRKKVGDTITIVDGVGYWYKATIISTTKKSCTVTIEETIEKPRARNFKLHMAIAPTKNMARFEWFLEKATEIGIDTITPLYCEHSERNRLRLDRCEKIVLSAMKQSLKGYLPILNDLTKFDDFVRNTGFGNAQKLIAHCEKGNDIHLAKAYEKGKDVVMLIGPEGDFSLSEIQTALQNSFKPVTFGASRLRTETAGIVACNSIHLLNV